MQATEFNLGNATFENYVGQNDGLSEMAFQMVAHVLTVGYAVMFAALIYFILTIKTVSPKYRTTAVLSVVVMVSAGLLLFIQAQNWIDAFTFDAERGRYFLADGAALFNNGYRYLNWLIDVPMLLFQILFVVSLTKSSFSSVRNRFWISGTLMIVTGYIGQYYEVTSPLWFAIWGFISTIFFVDILITMKKVINEGSEGIPADAQRYMGYIWTVFLFSWMLYPGAYLMPYLIPPGLEPSLTGLAAEAAVVGRQLTYTVADVTSKVIYGILLTVVAQIMSNAEGYDYNRDGETV
ncbi:MAG: bacteriorhodopsin [Balneolales bacterium]|nr:bacteriorhodopsin [Balneolales bacterium]